VIRRITSAGIILLVAGIPRACGFLGSGVLGTSARFGNGIRGTLPPILSWCLGTSCALILNASPFSDINPDLEGTGFVIGDQGTNTIRRLSASGIVTTLAGVGLGFAGNSQPNGPGTSARLFKPWVVLPESGSSLLILDRWAGLGAIAKPARHPGYCRCLFAIVPAAETTRFDVSTQTTTRWEPLSRERLGPLACA
jgi:hypothetical protein